MALLETFRRPNGQHWRLDLRNTRSARSLGLYAYLHVKV